MRRLACTGPKWHPTCAQNRASVQRSVLQSAQLLVGKRSALPSVLQSAQLSVGQRSVLPSVLQSAQQLGKRSVKALVLVSEGAQV